MSENNNPINPDLIPEDKTTGGIPLSELPQQEPPVQPVTPTHEVQQPVAPTYENQQPIAPTYESQQPVAPTYEAQQPVAPTYENQQPIAPTYEVQQPVAPTYENQQPVAPTYENQQPIAPTYESQQPVAPTYEAQQPVAPTYENQQPIAPTYEVQQPIAPTYEVQQPETQQPQQYPPYTTPAVMKPIAPNAWDGTAVKKQKKSIMPIVIIALSLLVLGVVGFLVYRFVLFDPAAHDPKGTLVAAVENTELDLKNTAISLPSQEKFRDQAISQTFNLKLDSAPDIIEFQPSLSGAKISLGLQSDIDNRESMVAFGFKSDVLEIPNSKVYFTSNQTVIDSPILYDKLLLIDNKTFIRDWNSSEFSAYSYIYEEGTLKDAIDETFDLFKAVDPESISDYEEMVREFEASLFTSKTLLNDSMVITHRETKDGRYVFDATLKGSDAETYIEDVTGVTEDLMYTILSSTPDIDSYRVESTMKSIVDIFDTLRDDLYFEDEIALEFVVDEETMRLIEYRILPTIITTETSYSDSETEVELEIIFSGDEGTIKDIDINIIAIPMDYPDDKVEIEIKRLSTGGGGKDSVRWEVLVGYTDGDYPEYSESYTLFLDYIWDRNVSNEDNFFLKMGMKNTSLEEEYLVNMRGVLVETADSLSISEGSFSFVYDNAQQFKVSFDYSCSVIDKGSIMPDVSGGVDFFSVDSKDLVSGLNDHLGGAV